ncbi:transcriptional repressor NrdR [Candidatus Parcubacteria bacterium]|nr:transcriptional repressor NrdR [Candidatus Parcubacteria bacterium]
MKCPICYHQDTKVVDSRVAVDGFSIRRRRECLKCGFRFSTYEEIEILDLTVIKNDGRKESYQKDKLIRGLKKSLEKRNVADDKFKKLINQIERDLQATRKSEIKSGRIGEIIMKHLKKLDKVAYIRYASVYKLFDDLESFQDELNNLIKKRRK